MRVNYCTFYFAYISKLWCGLEPGRLLRLHEFDQAVAAVREGMARVVPVPLFSLFTGFELETMVCGSPEIPIHLLKSVATYKVPGSNVS